MLTIARGQTASTGVVTVTALDDDEAGLGHDVAVLRGTPSDATPFVRVPALTTVRIFDDDATFPHIVIAPVQSSVFEGDTSTVVAALFPPSTEEVTVTIGVDEAHVDHDAEPGQYALSANRTLTVPAGSMRSTGVVTLTAADDGYYGPGWLRTVILEVASVAGADPGIRTGKLSDWHIYEDEAAPRVTLAVAPSVVAENGGRSAVTATLNTKLRNAAEISVTAVPAGPAATDGFVQTGTTLTIAADARTSTGTVTIDAVDDAVDGPDKRVVVAGTVPEPAGAVWFPLAEGLTIRDDDEPNTPPVFAGTGATRALAENVGDAATATAADIGAALPAATDADGGDTLTYGLDGADASSFGFDAANRRIRTKAGVTYDHEARSTYASLSLRVEDGNGGSAALPVAVAVTDVAEAPRAPAAPRVVPGTGSGTALSVRWTAPDNAGRPPIEDYDLRYRGGTGGGWLDGPRNVRETAATLGGLSADTSYQVQVLARNAEGQSDWSASGSGRTNADEGPADLAVLTMHARAGSVPSGGLAEWELRRSGGDMDWLKMSYRMEEADGIHTTAWGYLKPGQTKKSVSKYVYAQGTVVMRVTGPSQPRCTPSDAPSASCTDGYAVGSPSSASMRVTAPASSSPPDASVSGAVMTLRYAQALDAGSTPGPKDWVVRAATDAGARTLAVASVSVLGAEALLELKPPVVAGEEVAVSYLPWAMHPLRASEGMEAAPLTELPVRNETPPTLPFEPPADDAAVATDVADGRVAPPLGPWLSALLAERPGVVADAPRPAAAGADGHLAAGGADGPRGAGSVRQRGRGRLAAGGPVEPASAGPVAEPDSGRLGACGADGARGAGPVRQRARGFVAPGGPVEPASAGPVAEPGREPLGVGRSCGTGGAGAGRQRPCRGVAAGAAAAAGAAGTVRQPDGGRGAAGGSGLDRAPGPVRQPHRRCEPARRPLGPGVAGPVRQPGVGRVAARSADGAALAVAGRRGAGARGAGAVG